MKRLKSKVITPLLLMALTGICSSVLGLSCLKQLLVTLVASFSNIRSEIIILSVVILAAVAIALRKELRQLEY